MITEEQYQEAKNIIRLYESEQSKLLQSQRSSMATTSIPKECWEVHRTHCCSTHGCKYGYEDCPVELGIVEQEYKCEICQ